MDRDYTLKVIGGALILTLLLCAGIHFYAKWEYQRFAEELGEAPTFDASPEPVSAREMLPKVMSEEPVPPAPVEFKPLEVNELTPETSEPEPLELETEEPLFGLEDLPPLDAELEELSLDEVEFPSFPDEVPVEMVDAGIPARGYSDPSSLVNAFRTTYGDVEEVDIITEVLRRSGDGTATVDDIVYMTEALLRITPADQLEVRQSLINTLSELAELKQHELESGVTNSQIGFTYSIEE